MKRGNVYLQELKRRRIPEWFAPPVFRLAWLCGINVSPPAYWTTTSRALFLGIPLAFAMFATLLGIDVFWRQNVMNLWYYIALSAGLSMLGIVLFSIGVYFHRKKLATMPAWEDLKT